MSKWWRKKKPRHPLADEALSTADRLTSVGWYAAGDGNDPLDTVKSLLRSMASELEATDAIDRSNDYQRIEG